MVSVSIIVEGGVLGTKDAPGTVDNSNALRESLYWIFEEVLKRDDISVEVHMASGKRAAAKQFIGSNSDVFLYTDLDCKPEQRADWFMKMRTENPNDPIVFSQDKADRIFFMIQEMEAWILKQPDAIESWAKDRNYKHFNGRGHVSTHYHIQGKDIEQISKPSEKLADILKQTFQSDKLRKNGKIKGVEYGKLKTSPSMLKYLNVNLLLIHDAELNRFRNTVGVDGTQSTAMPEEPKNFVNFENMKKTEEI